uniref:Baeyer-Villiger monooxygenase peniC n=1 Tax=Penicillium patulum TaxID=5078 RepID=PENIC_PENPA|nr:PeniC [Penicillium griseofulvum]
MGSISPLPLTPDASCCPREVILEKYQQERKKRQLNCVPDNEATELHHKYAPVQGVDQPSYTRSPIITDSKVVIIGGGLAGLVTAVKLKTQGINDFVILEKGAECGGTWHWNQYPGAACDIESLIYLPLLEETGYVPQSRYSSGAEIRAHVARIILKWNLGEHICPLTQVTSTKWDESKLRWEVQTDHSDSLTCQFLVLATGLFHEPNLPRIPGSERFKGDQFHSGRWDYAVTGGDPAGSVPMDKLATKTVGVIGTGASGVQIVPRLAQDAKKLYVFQRTPSSITARDNYTMTPLMTEPVIQKPGWQRARMVQFCEMLEAEEHEMSDKDGTVAEGFDALSLRKVLNGMRKDDVAPAQMGELYARADISLMESIRKHVSNTVDDHETAEKLKPWYPFLCKRPVFQNDYLSSFNRSTVELVDTNGQGVSCLTEKGVVANGKEHEVDLLIYATGFDYEIGTPFYQRTRIHVFGSHGQTLDDAWADQGPSTLFGIHIRDFPNLLYIGPCQAGVTFNFTHTIYEAADHISHVIGDCLKDGASFQAIQPSIEAQSDWVKQTEEGSEMRLQYAQSCPPGYFNGHGRPEKIPARWGYYPKGIKAWANAMRECRAEGMKGLERW